MPNKSFYHLLFKDAPDSEPLSWGRRLLIMIGVARGLTYMHSTNLIHRGVKSIDILLDEDFNAKLGDFGSVKYGPGTGKTHITTLVKGSSGYVDPEYYKTGHLTMKTDIYGFGMVVLESITGRPAIFFSNDEPQTLVKWVSDKGISNGRQLKKIMDPCLEGKYPLKGAFKCFALAARCLADNPKDRPSSKKVQKTLEHIYALYK